MKYSFCLCLLLFLHVVGAAVVERLHVSPFKRKTRIRSRSWIPHIIHLFSVYINLIHHRPSDGDAQCRSRVSGLYSGHVKEPGWLWLNSRTVSECCLSFLSSIHANCVNIMTWIAYIVLKGRKTPVPPPPLFITVCINKGRVVGKQRHIMLHV